MTFIPRSVAAGLAAALSLTGLAACSNNPAGPSQTAPGQAAPLKVAVAFYPFEFVAQRVGGDLVTVENLTTPGAEAHDVELTPRQLGGLAEADLVVYQSGFQPAVDDALTQVTPKRTLDTAAFLTLLTAEGDDGHDHGQEEGEEHADEEQADDHAEEGDDDHDHGAYDPHTWLDPTNLAAIAEHVRDALSETDPSHAEAFAANATALVADLTALDQESTDGLAQCQRTTFITSHAAFGYLAHRYHLEQVGIRGLEPDVEPTAARIAEVQQIARDEGVTTIFFETLVSPVVAESIARDLGLATDVLDPLEGLTDESRGNDYLEVMRANLSALRTANSCS